MTTCPIIKYHVSIEELSSGIYLWQMEAGEGDFHPVVCANQPGSMLTSGDPAGQSREGEMTLVYGHYTSHIVLYVHTHRLSNPSVSLST